MSRFLHSIVRWFLVLALLAGCRDSQPLPPGTFDVSVTLSVESAAIGEQITLLYTARHPAGSHIRFPDPDPGGPVRILSRQTDLRTLHDTSLKTTKSLVLTSFRPGTYRLFSEPVVCVFADGTEKHRSPETPALSFQGVLRDGEGAPLDPLKAPLRTPVDRQTLLLVLLAVATLAALAAVVTLRSAKHKSAAEILPPESAGALARRALAKLRETPWSPTPFFTELSLILRTYLENRFALHAPEMTTDELTRHMTGDQRLDPIAQQSLRSFLLQADLVKFARADAAQETMLEAFATVERFVEQTDPPTPEPPTGANS